MVSAAAIDEITRLAHISGKMENRPASASTKLSRVGVKMSVGGNASTSDSLLSATTTAHTIGNTHSARSALANAMKSPCVRRRRVAHVMPSLDGAIETAAPQLPA